MPALRKFEEVKELEDVLRDAQGAVGINYRGLTVAQTQELRKILRPTGARYQVVKNTLAEIAAANVGKAGIKDVLSGPTGVVIITGDVVAPIKALTDHLRVSRSVATINGAYIGGRIIKGDELDKVAELPSREVLLAQALGLLNAPAQQIVNVMSAHLRSIVTVLQRRKEQLEGSQGG